MKLYCLNLICALSISLASSAAVIPLDIGSPYSQDFDFPALADKPNGGQSRRLPGGWSINDGRNDEYRIGNGRIRVEDIYSFGAKTLPDRALGSLSDGLPESLFGAQFRNDSGQTITHLNISYWGEEWRLGANYGRLDRLDFQYSVEAESLTTGKWIDFDLLDFITPDTTGCVGARDGNDAQNRAFISASLPLNIPDGETFWIRWKDANARGAEDGLAVDDFAIVAVPEVSTILGGIGALTILLGLTWRQRRRCHSDC